MKTKNIIIIIGSIVFGLFLGWIFFSGGENEKFTSEETVAHEWTCSMHPEVRKEEPGRCPICGMDLIPVQNSVEKEDPDAVQMSEYAKKLANVETTILGGREELSNEIRLNGKIAVDERLSYSQSTHIPGRIERLYVNFTGEEIKTGQPLAQIYSPEMVTAQEELLQAYAIRESNGRLFEAAKQKLRNWKIGENQINRIIETQQANERFTIRSDVNGIVTEKLVETGDYVERGMPLYEIADLSRVWVLFDIYENDMSWIEEGSMVEFNVASIPGETFTGKIDFIDPVINPQTRVSTARVVVNNKKGILKPGMFVSGIIKNRSENQIDKLTVPKSAVLWTGTRSVVYVENEDGGFEMREITLGPVLGNSYVVSEGLKAGEKVVINGTFSIDAAAQLAGKPSMMNKNRSAEIIEIPSEAKEELKLFLNEYFEIKNALVTDNFKAAKENAGELLKMLQDKENSEIAEMGNETWRNKQLELIMELNHFVESENIEDFREIFLGFSETFIEILNTYRITNEGLYVLYCPMANSDQGGNWLSRSSEIRNPYYGQAMLSCGEVVKEIN